MHNNTKLKERFAFNRSINADHHPLSKEWVRVEDKYDLFSGIQLKESSASVSHALENKYNLFTGNADHVYVDELMFPLVKYLNSLPHTQTINCCQGGNVFSDGNVWLKTTDDDFTIINETLSKFIAKGEIGQYNILNQIHFTRQDWGKHPRGIFFVMSLFDTVALLELNEMVFNQPPTGRYSDAKNFFNELSFYSDLARLINPIEES